MIIPVGRLDEASRRIIVSLVRHGPLPRTDLARQAGLSSGSVTRLSRPLVAEGFLRELPPRTAVVGRPSVPLEVRAEAGCFVGFKVVTGHLYGVRTGLTGVTVESFDRPIDTTSAQTTAREISATVNELSERFAIDAVGVGLAGAVDPSGTIRAAVLLDWDGGNLQDDITARTGQVCVSTNDVDAFALGEHWFGVGRGSECFVVLTIGEGVGAGVIVGDEALKGYEGAAAMLGAAWLPDGRDFHEVLSSGAIRDRVGALVGRPVTYAEALASDSDAVRAELDAAVAALGHLVGLATLTYGPDRVMLSGEGIPLVLGRTAHLMRAFSARRFYDVDLPQVIIKVRDPYAWARGAAVRALQHTLAPSRPELSPTDQDDELAG